MLGDSQVVAQIPVSDLERAGRFYTDVLGLKPGDTFPDVMMLDAGDGTSIALYTTPSAGAAQHTLASWKVNDLRTEMKELRSRGVTFEDYDMPNLVTKDGVVTMDGGGMASWFKDPDGNILCVAQM